MPNQWKTKTHEDLIINWKVIFPIMIFIGWGLPTVIFYPAKHVFSLFGWSWLLIAMGFWIKSRWIYKRELVIVNRKKLDEGQTLVEVAREGNDAQAGRYIEIDEPQVSKND
jgi:hypothetical protein